MNLFIAISLSLLLLSPSLFVSNFINMIYYCINLNRFLMKNDMLSTEGCSFSLSTDEFMDEPIAMIISQDSPYTKIINAE